MLSLQKGAFFSNKPKVQLSTQRIHRIIRNFSALSVAWRFAGLQLDPRNAHVQGLLEAVCLTAFQSRSSANQTLTHLELSRLVRDAAFNEGSLVKRDDPHEHLFTSRFPSALGSFHVFPGATWGGTAPLLSISAALGVLEEQQESGAKEARDLINGALKLSHQVISAAGLQVPAEPTGRHWNDDHPSRKTPLIFLPEESILLRNQQALTFNDADLSELTPDERLMVEQWLTQSSENLNDSMTGQPDCLQLRPILRIDTQCLLLAPHALLAATARATVRLIQETGLSFAFDKALRETERTRVRMALSRLACNELREMGTELIDGSWYDVDVDKFLSVTIAAQPVSSVRTDVIADHWDITLPESSPKYDLMPRAEVVHLVVVVDLGDSFRASLPLSWPEQRVIAMRTEDLELLSSEFRNDVTVLWRLARSRSAFRRTVGGFHLHQPLDEIAMLAAGDFPPHSSLPKGSAVMLAGTGVGWRRRIQMRRDERLLPWTDGKIAVLTEHPPSTPSGVYLPLVPCWSREHVAVAGQHQVIWVVDGQGHALRTGEVAKKPDGIWRWQATASIVDQQGSVQSALTDLLPDLVHGVALWINRLVPFMNPLARTRTMAIYLAVGTHPEPVRAYTDPPNDSVWVMLGPAFISEMQRPENYAERRLVGCLIQAFTQLALLHAAAAPLTLLDQIIPFGDSRLFMSQHLHYDVQLNPRGLVPVRYVRSGDTEAWAIFVGTQLSKRRKWKPGRPLKLVPEDMKEGVGLLFTELERRLALLDGALLLPFLLAHYEALRFDHAQLLVSLIPRRLTYGEHTKPFNVHSEETSVALRFLVECVAARPPSGEQFPSLLELDDLMAMAVQLIHLGGVGDALLYRLGEVQAGLHPNGALFAQANEFMAAQQKLQRHAVESMARSANAQRYDVVAEAEQDEDPFFQQVISALCEAICGVRIEQFFRFVNGALNIGDRFGGEVVQMARTEFLTELQQETGEDLQTVTHLLALLSLADRGGLLSVPRNVSLSEVFPWQFNRELSFLRRPFVLLGAGPEQQVLWGNRALAASRSFWMQDQFISGRLKVPSKGQPGHREAAQALEKLRTRRGAAFNEEVAALVRQLGFSVLTNKKKFGPMKMSADGDDLGDIDVLIYDRELRQLVLLESKAYVPARTPQELHSQIEELIDGRRRPSGSRERPLTERHLRRAVWVRDNLQMVLSHLNLGDEVGWTVRAAYVMADFPNAMLRERAPLPILSLKEVHVWLLLPA